MAAIYSRDGDEWRREQIARQALVTFEPLHVSPLIEVSLPSGAAAIALIEQASRHRWIAIIPSGIRVSHNGVPVTAGLRVLSDRDSLATRGSMVFFSGEEVPHAAPFAGSEPVSCPRCLRVIAPGEQAVVCPGCGRAHHELSDRTCWTYAETCALCPQPTALNAGPAWSPEAL